MTKKELAIMYIIKSIIESRTTTKNAAYVLGLNKFQIKHLKKGVKKDGEVFIVRKNRNCKPKYTIPNKIKNKIVFLALSKYESTNYTHLSELLREFKGITISQSSLSRILKAKGKTPENINYLNLTALKNVNLKKGFYCKWMPSPMNGYPA